MRILDRYIVGSITKIFLSTIAIFCLLYLLIDITSQLDEFIDRKIPIPILVEYYIFFFPTIIVQIASIACLISTLFAFAGLNNSNEVTAMRASGLNFWQITKSALCFSLLISAMTFFLNEQIVPSATAVTNKIRNENMVLFADRAHETREKVNDLTFYGLKNRLYFIDSFEGATNTLNGITMIEYDNEANIQNKVVALKGVWTGIAWKFYNCQITEYTNGEINHPTKIKVYEDKLMDIKETPDDFLRQNLNVSAMNTKQLKEYIKRFSDSGAKRALNNLRVDLHQKIAYPIGTFVIVLVGLPFAMMIKNRKGTTFTTIGIAIVIGFLYYVANAVSIAFGKGGLFPPMLAAWMAPMVFIGAGVTIIESDFR